MGAFTPGGLWRSVQFSTVRRRLLRTFLGVGTRGEGTLTTRRPECLYRPTTRSSVGVSTSFPALFSRPILWRLKWPKHVIWTPSTRDLRVPHPEDSRTPVSPEPPDSLFLPVTFLPCLTHSPPLLRLTSLPWPVDPRSISNISLNKVRLSLSLGSSQTILLTTQSWWAFQNGASRRLSWDFRLVLTFVSLSNLSVTVIGLTSPVTDPVPPPVCLPLFPSLDPSKTSSSGGLNVYLTRTRHSPLERNICGPPSLNRILVSTTSKHPFSYRSQVRVHDYSIPTLRVFWGFLQLVLRRPTSSDFPSPDLRLYWVPSGHRPASSFGTLSSFLAAILSLSLRHPTQGS